MFNIGKILLDWLMFCALTPKFVMILGTEGSQAYTDYLFHSNVSITGAVLSIVAGLIIAGIVALI